MIFTSDRSSIQLQLSKTWQKITEDISVQSPSSFFIIVPLLHNTSIFDFWIWIPILHNTRICKKFQVIWLWWLSTNKFLQYHDPDNLVFFFLSENFFWNLPSLQVIEDQLYHYHKLKKIFPTTFLDSTHLTLKNKIKKYVSIKSQTQSRKYIDIIITH